MTTEPGSGGCRLGISFSPYYDGGGGVGVVTQARLAESLGFDDLWCPDHVIAFRPMGDVQVMAAMGAAVTERIHICLGVLQGGMRHPVALAKWIGALAHEAPGRIVAGLGVGGDFGMEWEALGLDARQRGRRFEEVLSVLPRLLANETVSHQGEFFTFQTAPLFGSAPNGIPLWIGARKETAMRRALAADGWYGMNLRPDEFASHREVLRSAALASGKQPPQTGVALVASILGSDAEARNRCAEFFRSAYGLPSGRGERRALGGISAVEDMIAGYKEAGADRVSVTLVDPPDEAWPLLAKACLG
jgi:alkanesulfonate monooxygenase SsuD/methylene tetrahydromethanopterin reductase-like flavin-dependent oxidoreductase (luciferase family)